MLHQTSSMASKQPPLFLQLHGHAHKRLPFAAFAGGPRRFTESLETYWEAATSLAYNVSASGTATDNYIHANAGKSVAFSTLQKVSR